MKKHFVLISSTIILWSTDCVTAQVCRSEWQCTAAGWTERCHLFPTKSAWSRGPVIWSLVKESIEGYFSFTGHRQPSPFRRKTCGRVLRPGAIATAYRDWRLKMATGILFDDSLSYSLASHCREKRSFFSLLVSQAATRRGGRGKGGFSLNGSC